MRSKDFDEFKKNIDRFKTSWNNVSKAIIPDIKNELNDMFVVPYTWPADLLTSSNDIVQQSVHDNDKERVIIIYAAGFSKSNMCIQYDKNVLTVNGGISEYTTSHHQYMKQTKFSKSFTLFEDTHDVNNTRAEYNDGVLTITIPKLEVKKTSVKTIEIK